MPDVNPTTSLGALVAERPARARLFERLHFDYCCAGAQTLAEACAKRGLDAATVAEMLAAVDAAAPDRVDPREECDWRRASLAELCDHIIGVHHHALRRDLPRIGDMLATVVRVHGHDHPELRDTERVFESMRAELDRHLALEEGTLFPACRLLEASEPPEPGLEELLSHHEDDHAGVGDALAALRELTDDYDASRARCGTHRALLDALRRFELDMHQHIHEENNVLFPRARALTTRGAGSGPR